MATVNFTGSVQLQEHEGETVTITVVKPDGAEDIIETQTLADKSFSAQKEYPPGKYNAVARVEADGTYASMSSILLPFTVPHLDRTITLSVDIV